MALLLPSRLSSIFTISTLCKWNMYVCFWRPQSRGNEVYNFWCFTISAVFKEEAVAVKKSHTCHIVTTHWISPEDGGGWGWQRQWKRGKKSMAFKKPCRLGGIWDICHCKFPLIMITKWCESASHYAVQEIDRNGTLQEWDILVILAYVVICC